MWSLSLGYSNEELLKRINQIKNRAKIPKLRKPIAPPNKPHKSKKDYNRKKQKEIDYEKDAL